MLQKLVVVISAFFGIYFSVLPSLAQRSTTKHVEKHTLANLHPKQFVLYIAPNGDDKNSGTIEHPIRTLEYARNLMRLVNQAMRSDITVYLHGGTYRLERPFELGPSDSGNNGHNIIYAAVPGEKPVISGSEQVTGWQHVAGSNSLWIAPAPLDLNNTRQLYVDGIRAQRTRGRLPVNVIQTNSGYIADSPIMANWKNPADIEFVYTGGNTLWSEEEVGLGPWTEPRCPVASMENTIITIAQPCWRNSTERVILPREGRAANLVGPTSVGKKPAYIENAFELLRSPGQWYFDRSTHTIYYVPRPGEDMTKADVEVPILEKLVVAHGAKGNPIHNIIFSGLRFSYATWLQPSSVEGFSEIQANFTITGKDGYSVQGLCKLVPDGTCPYGSWNKIPGNVSFTYDNNIQFISDAFVHLGAAGLELGNGTQADLVQGCIFTDISGNGLELGDVNLPMAEGADITRDNRIINNHIYNIATEFHGGIGIFVGYAEHSLIQYNQLDHLPYSAISTGWGGWLDKVHQPGLDNNSEGNVIANNLIFDYVLTLGDGGAIYTQGMTGKGLTTGEKITGNFIYNQFGSGHGIFTDDSAGNITISGNVIFHTNYDNWGGKHSSYYGDDNGEVYVPLQVMNNYWEQGLRDISDRNVTIRNNRIITALTQAPTAILQNAGLRPSYKHILSERFSEPMVPEAPSQVAAAPGNEFAYISWTPPANEGDAAIQSYTVTSSKGDQISISSADFWKYGYVRMPGLANGTEYTFIVAAISAYGTSSYSLPSAPITPKELPINQPAPPTNVSAFAAEGRATIF